jgi:thiamine-phosphate pyrophosphorylase
MPSVLRIIDANANRAREALRVMEEAARFVLDDAPLTEAIKQLRHDLAAQLRRIDALEANRDTPGDVGTHIATSSEAARASVADVAIAAGKRLSEALRTIEEYSKTINVDVAAHVEQLRYRGYDIEQSLTRALATGRATQWSLCVLISESLCPGGDWLKVARAAVEGGADCIQLREKQIDGGDLLDRTRRLIDICRPKDAAVIVNDRPDIALLAGADGVHVGQSDLPCADVRKLVGRQLLLGVSTSQLHEAKQAQRDGADYCGVGPMFPTATKRKDVIVGPTYLKQYLAWNKLPHLAIAGITPDNIDQLLAVGVRGVAVSSIVCGADDPAAVAGQLIDRLGATR